MFYNTRKENSEYKCVLKHKYSFCWLVCYMRKVSLPCSYRSTCGLLNSCCARLNQDIVPSIGNHLNKLILNIFYNLTRWSSQSVTACFPHSLTSSLTCSGLWDFQTCLNDSTTYSLENPKSGWNRFPSGWMLCKIKKLDNQYFCIIKDNHNLF